MPTVLVAGTFDGLHPGHEDLFRQAKELGDRLVVVVALDRTVLSVKGHLPRFDQEQRKKTVALHPLVDQAMLGREGDKYAIIAELHPDIVLLGYDQEAFTADLATEMSKKDVHCRIMRATAYKPEQYKSSLLFGDIGTRNSSSPGRKQDEAA